MKYNLFNRIFEIVKINADLSELNERMYELTGIKNYFLIDQDRCEFLEREGRSEITRERRVRTEYGDFQTSRKLALSICSNLAERGFNPTVVIEPTSGIGNFILATLKTFKKVSKVIGVELQYEYVKACKNLLLEQFLSGSFGKTDIEIHHDDIFIHDFGETSFDDRDNILIIGNPPWVTNSELQGRNVPKKSNFKKANGFDAITGKANFDISEYIILHLLQQFKYRRGKLALLCKTQVARNIIEFLPATDLTASNFEMLLLDAKKEFNASVNACLFLSDLSGSAPDYSCKVTHFSNAGNTIGCFGWSKGNFVSDIDEYKKTSFLDGISPLVWRSGVKHNCAKVMELELSPEGILYNGLGEEVSIEQDLVYPLLKGSQLKLPVIKDTSKRLIVTQKRLGQDTTYIKENYPLLWEYLVSHEGSFDRRRSVLYRKSPRFSLFGVGEYSFSPYKIAISGLYKDSLFSMVAPIDNKPVMLDDSCYLLGLSNRKHALILLALLNSKLIQDFLRSVTFIDAKRPYTKNILMRVALLEALTSIGLAGVSSYFGSNNLSDISKTDYEEFREFLTTNSHHSGHRNYAKSRNNAFRRS